MLDRRGVVRYSTRVRIAGDRVGRRASRVAETSNEKLERFWKGLSDVHRRADITCHDAVRRHARASRFDCRLQRTLRGPTPGRALIEAACWAHTRRKFFDVHAKTGSAVALEALERLGTLYEVDRSISGKPPDERGRQRQARSRPLATALKAWAETILPQLSGASDLARAFRYMLARWTALTRVFDDGRIALDNNPAERALRSVADAANDSSRRLWLAFLVVAASRRSSAAE